MSKLERVDQLCGNDLKIIQSKDIFCFSMDAVLLADFANIPRKGKILDLCTGTGVIPLLLSRDTEARIVGVEIQSRLVDMANRSVKLNHLQEQIHITCQDLKTFEPTERYDYITVNPPYLSLNGGDIKENEFHATARHEINCTLEDVIRACARLLKAKGKLALIHRPARLNECITLMEKYQISPKRIRFVHPQISEESNMVLIEAIFLGKQTGTRILPPLIVYQDAKQYTAEIKKIYREERVN